jgi:hypothetical protein
MGISVRLALRDCRGVLLSCEGLWCGIAWRAPAPHRRELREAFVRDAEQRLHEARDREQHLLHGITGLEEERVRGPEVEKLFCGGKIDGWPTDDCRYACRDCARWRGVVNHDRGDFKSFSAGVCRGERCR